MAANRSTTALWRTTTSSPEEEEAENSLRILNFWVPLIIVIIVLGGLCMVLMYAKARRRRLAMARGPGQIASVSGGVAQNAFAYRNYGQHLSRAQTDVPVTPMTQPQSSTLTIPYNDLPPTYEDAMKYDSLGIGNESFLADASAELPSPPPYGANSTEHLHDNRTDTIPAATLASPAPSGTTVPSGSAVPDSPPAPSAPATSM